MNKEKQRLKDLYKKKNEMWEVSAKATERKNHLLQKMKELVSSNSYYDIEFTDVHGEAFEPLMVIKKEYARVGDTLFCLTRANGQLVAYSFLYPDEHKKYRFLRCREHDLGKEDPSLTLANCGFNLTIVHEQNGKFLKKDLQYIGCHVYDYDRKADASNEVATLAHETVDRMRYSQKLFSTIKTTFAFQEKFKHAMIDNSISFSKAGGYYLNKDVPQFAICFRLNKVIDKPITLFTPHSDQVFTTFDKNSEIHLPFDQTSYATSDALKRIAKVDFIDLPIFERKCPEKMTDIEK